MAIKRYAVDGTDTNTASTTLLGITSTTTVRPAVYDFTIGSDTTPADQAANYAIQRYTAAGTSTAVTPQAIDPADPSALSSAGEAHSVEPTYTAGAILFSLALNQRATYRWVAAPGSELVMPASAANGLGWQTIAVTSAFANCRVSALYME